MRLGFLLFPLLLMISTDALASNTHCPPPSPPSAKGWVETGNCLAGRKQWLEAESAYRAAQRQDPDLTAAAIGHAQTLMAMGEPALASVELEQFAGQHPDSLPALLLHARWLDELWNDKKEAARILEKCSSLAPLHTDIWRTLGFLQFQLDLFEEAQASFQQGLRINPSDPRLELGLGRCLERLGDPAEAEKAFQRALTLNRKNPKPLAEVPFLYAEFLYRQNRFTESIASYGKALALNPKSADAYMGRGLARAKLQQKDGAAADAQKALEIGGDRMDAHRLLLSFSREADDQEKMRFHADQIGRLAQAEEQQHQRNRQLRQLLREGKPLMAEGKYAEAAPRFEQIIKMSPENLEAYFALAVCYSQTGRPKESIELLRKYLEKRPTEADAHVVLGLLLLDGGKIPDARRAFERALELDPAQEEARQALAAMAPSTLVP